MSDVVTSSPCLVARVSSSLCEDFRRSGALRAVIALHIRQPGRVTVIDTVVLCDSPWWEVDGLTATLMTKQRLQLFDGRSVFLFVDDELHQFPCAAALVFPPEIPSRLPTPILYGNFSCETNLPVVVDEHYVSGRHLLPSVFVHRAWDRAPGDEV